MKVQAAATKEELQKRLRRIEGQIRGVQKMIDEARAFAAAEKGA